MTLGWAAAGGGAIGAWLRFQISGWVYRSTWADSLAGRLPLGTLAVNLSGCFLLGLLAGVLQARGDASPALRTFLLVGVLGGYTTFSTFAVESLELLRAGYYGLGVANVCGSPLLGLVGAWCGDLLARGLTT